MPKVSKQNAKCFSYDAAWHICTKQIVITYFILRKGQKVPKSSASDSDDLADSSPTFGPPTPKLIKLSCFCQKKGLAA